MSFYNSFNLPVTIARPFNTYGPRQSARAIIPTIITQIAIGMKEIMLGDLTPTRDFNYVKDTCIGFLKIAECDETIGKEINIRVTSIVKNKTTTSNTSFTPPSFIHIPVSAGFKYYEDKFIIGVGIGTGISKLKDVDMESSTKLMINPMAGYDFGKVILGANYSITTIGDGNTNKYIGVRLSIKISE